MQADFLLFAFLATQTPLYVSEYEGMRQQKAASTVLHRLPAIVEDH